MNSTFFISLAALLISLSACGQEIADPRIPYVEYTKEQVNTIEVLAETRKGNQKLCYDEFMKDYLAKVYEHCEATDYAKKIAGGCGHVIHSTKKYAWQVKWVALEECGIKTKI